MAFDPFGEQTKSLITQTPEIFMQLPKLRSPAAFYPSMGMNFTEKIAYQLLQNEFAVKYRITPQVPLKNVFEINARAFVTLYKLKGQGIPSRNRKKVRRSIYTRLKGKIGKKSADFMICDPSSNKILGCIEIDGVSHRTQPQIGFDYTKNLLFLSQGIMVLRVTNGEVIAANNPSVPCSMGKLLMTAKERWHRFANNPIPSNVILHRP